MKFRNQDILQFARNATCNSNILYECSVFCDKNLHSNGFLGIYKDSCFCISASFRFPHTPECLDTDFLDINTGIFVFKLFASVLNGIQSSSADFNCLVASIQESGKTSYYSTKCASTLYSICQQRVDSDLSNKCQPRQGGFCFNEENSTLLEHYRKCWRHNGTLMPMNSGITEHFSAMLGSFRAFKSIEEENHDNDSWSCLSITPFNGTIYLEAENCSNENALRCMDDIQDASNKDESASTYGVRSYAIIIIIVSILSVILFASVLVVFVFKGMFKCIRTLHTPMNLNEHEPEERSSQARVEEEAVTPFIDETINPEAGYNPSPRVPEDQQSKNTYNHLPTRHDKDDDNTYDMTRFHKV